MMQPHIRSLAQLLWDYHHMNHELVKSDAVLVLCSHDEMVACRAAELFLEGWAPLLIFSGGLGSITKNLWSDPEADRFARIAEGMGVPRDKILIENRSTNTGDNVRFTRELLSQKGVNINRFIVVQKPYMERRSFATFRKLWPEVELVVTSPQVTLDEYLLNYSNRSLSVDDVVSIMVGDLQRIKIYPERGFQIEQEIPVTVLDAYEKLVEAGYNRHLASI